MCGKLGPTFWKKKQQKKTKKKKQAVIFMGLLMFCLRNAV